MNARVRLSCLLSIGMLLSACETMEPGAADYALIKCPVSQEQATTAQVHVNHYLAAVGSGHRPPPRSRYIAVKTLPPNKKQTAAYIKKRQAVKEEAAAKNEALPAKWAEPSQLKCVCIYDTQSKQFVGTVCYVVSTEPAIGELARFETMSAEFVGTGTEPPPGGQR